MVEDFFGELWMVFLPTKVPSKNGTVQGALVEGCASQDDIATAAWSRWGHLRDDQLPEYSPGWHHLPSADEPSFVAHGATVSSANFFWSRKAEL